ncbi:uncharacterized protein CANTADRAFT_25127 [Suhomyces tanzawaensis NRRL Y-17324]|uniref:Uncharacterized protein n=1 Tax=Suhomyces tanzawaensis NRRL Y-17324 TaxID=984487 RepID=A0A1E4SME2_9ASCO|nr:uncharacterized protein CANTADRAFT_25127 [Suhomyces tanzawaensis NRRL Y-17324]ODV80696.1 hypothetical protein CANTADRAFT_25127 [Suhomyces tanzawaensis NRRL Y-17324]
MGLIQAEVYHYFDNHQSAEIPGLMLKHSGTSSKPNPGLAGASKTSAGEPSED